MKRRDFIKGAAVAVVSLPVVARMANQPVEECEEKFDNIQPSLPSDSIEEMMLERHPAWPDGYRPRMTGEFVIGGEKRCQALREAFVTQTPILINYSDLGFNGYVLITEMTTTVDLHSARTTCKFVEKIS